MPMSPGTRQVLHYYGYLHPILCLLIGAFFLVAPAYWLITLPLGNLVVLAIMGAVGLAFLAYGAFMLRRQLKEDPTTSATPALPMGAEVVLTIQDLPPAEGARRLRYVMWIIAIGSISGTASVAYDLAQVEFGTERSVRMWAPIAWLYNHLGFWPAVLVVPVVGLLALFALATLLRTIKERQTGRI